MFDNVVFHFVIIAICSVTLSFSVKTTQYIDITYSSTRSDSFDVRNTNDTTVCRKYNANYDGVSSVNNYVTCICGDRNEMFYGTKYYEPRCASENDGQLYGCPCTTTKCSSTITSTKTTLVEWTFSDFNCQDTTTKWQILKWDGKAFKTTNSYAADFDLEFSYNKLTEKSNFKMKWSSSTSRSIAMSKYRGGLFKIRLYCNNAFAADGRCFIMKGIGKQTGLEFTSSSSSTDSSSSKTSSSVIGTVSSILFLIVILVVIFCVRKRRISLIRTVVTIRTSPQQEQQLQVQHTQNVELKNGVVNQHVAQPQAIPVKDPNNQVPYPLAQYPQPPPYNMPYPAVQQQQLQQQPPPVYNPDYNSAS